VTGHACREIRHGRLTRFKAKNIIQYFQHQLYEYLDLLETKEIPQEFLFNLYPNKNKWIQGKPSNWRLNKHSKIKSNNPSNPKIIGSILNDSLSRCSFTEYITIVKEYPEV